MKSFILGLCLLPMLCLAESTLVFNTTGKSPLNSKDGSGFMDRVSEEALSRIGYKLTRVQIPAERGLINVNQGIDDGEMSRIAGLEKHYPNLRQVTEKIMDWEFVVFSKKIINTEAGWSSLANKNVGFINGWKILENNVPASAIIIKVKNEKLLFGLLDKDRVDYIIFEKWGGLEIIDKNKYKQINIANKPLAVREMFIYVHKKHKLIVNPLAKALENMKEDGSYHKLKKEILLDEF